MLIYVSVAESRIPAVMIFLSGGLIRERKCVKRRDDARFCFSPVLKKIDARRAEASIMRI